MREFENKEYKVTIEGNKVVVLKKKFEDKYVAYLDEDNALVAKTSSSLAQAMKCRAIFGF